MKVGIAVECPKCGKTKAPRGRSVATEIYVSYCNRDYCPFYWDFPKPGDLFPGETEEQFGYHVGPNGIEER